VPNVLSASDIRTLLDALDEAHLVGLRRGDTLFGARNLLTLPAVRDIANTHAIRDLVEPATGPTAKPVRATLFDKTQGANWPVLWHQDLSLALAGQHDIPGWGPWSVKAGVPHVHAPADILERMIAVRLHLDPCGSNNGPLRVVPRTHGLGRLSRDRIQELRREIDETICTADVGTALLMRPLLLHASSSATTPSHRRVLHIEFAPEDLLPKPLAWAH
jgi:ectoine hydroxylase-related dioxygenase (phytanoyl-CoA dioxygenase family)